MIRFSKPLIPLLALVIVCTISTAEAAANRSCVHRVKCRTQSSSSKSISSKPKKASKSSKAKLPSFTSCKPSAWKCTPYFVCKNGITKNNCLLLDRTCLNPEAVRPADTVKCTNGMQSSSTSSKVISNLELAKFLAKSESNMEVMADNIDAYRDPSHQSLVDDWDKLLWDYKGLHAQLKLLGKQSETRELNAEENKTALDLMKQMNDMIIKSNAMLPR